MGTVYGETGAKWAWYTMAHSGSGIRWDWGKMGLVYRQWDSDTVGLIHNGTGAKWAWYTLGMGQIGPDIQWDWGKMGLVHIKSGTK